MYICHDAYVLVPVFYVCECMCREVCMCVCAFTHVCMCACLCMCLCACAFVPVHVSVHACMYVCICMCMCACVERELYIYIERQVYFRTLAHSIVGAGKSGVFRADGQAGEELMLHHESAGCLPLGAPVCLQALV